MKSTKIRTEAPEVAQESNPAPAIRLQLILVALLTAALIPFFLFVRAAATEVTRYSALTFEAHARDALDAGNPREALEICTGAIRSTLGNDTFWGTAYLLSAKAHAALGDNARALGSLEQAASFWSRRYYFARPSDQQEAAAWGRGLGTQFLESGLTAEALRAYSAAARASGHPLEFLHALTAELPQDLQDRVWVEAPALVLQDFSDSDTLAALSTSSQNLVPTAREVIEETGLGRTVARLVLPSTEGESVALFAPLYMPLAAGAFHLRTQAQLPPEATAQLLLNVWVEQAQESVRVVVPASEVTPDGWLRFEVSLPEVVNAQVMQQGYQPEDGFLNQVGLVFRSDSEIEILLDAVEIVAAD